MTRRRTVLSTLALLLLLFAMVASWRSHETTAQAPVPRPVVSQTRLPAAGSASAPLPPATPQPKAATHARMGGSVRLAPGQTGVLTYFSGEPGKTGVLQVTPEIREDGTVALETRFMETSDAAITRTGLVGDLMPDIFNMERLTALDAGELRDFSSALVRSEQTKTVSYPRLVSRLGSPVLIRSLVSLEDGTPTAGIALSLSARRVGNQDDLDVSIALDTYTPPADEE